MIHTTPKKFYITGFPRSGTAWCALFMTHGGLSFCHHEQERRKMDSPMGIEYLGNSSSGLILYDLPKDGPVIYIDRKVEDAVLATTTEIGEQGYRVEQGKMLALMQAAEQTKIRADVVIGFEDLFTEIGARKLWQSCIKTHPFPKERFEQLQNMNVQIHRWDY